MKSPTPRRYSRMRLASLEEPFGNWDPNLEDPSQPRSFANQYAPPPPEDVAALQAFAKEWRMEKALDVIRGWVVMLWPDEEGWWDRSLPRPAIRTTVGLLAWTLESNKGVTHDQVHRNPCIAVHQLINGIDGSAADHDTADLLLSLGGVAAVLRYLKEG